MTHRVVIGKRSNGDSGIFISPAGVDALTAADSALILNISRKIPQLLFLGYVTASATVALGLSVSPIVFVTSQDTIKGVGYDSVQGPIRPSPSGTYTYDPSGPTWTLTTPSSVAINSGGASMTITALVKTSYAVYNSPL